MDKSEAIFKKRMADKAGDEKKQGEKKWKEPKLEDVSGKIMAQPYIRFT